MATVVIMPGGFHPFHAGHLALYQSAQRAFPDAEVYVAATNDTSARPFPFPVKEKLAKLAGVEPGHFVQVKSPFRAEEITSKFDPDQDTLIFVRSEKDSDKPPQAGGVKRDGSPSYLQPLLGAKKLEPFSKHAYMAYLPTVEFGPGMTSATEIRAAWPQLNDKRKTALVMSLYPRTQGNEKLAATVVGLLDTALDVVGESALDTLPRPNKRNQFKSLHKQRKQRGLDEQGVGEGSLNEFAPGGNSASSYYAVTANFVNEFAQQKQEELQDLIDAGWTKQDLAQAGTLESHESDIAHFEQVRDGFLKGLKPGFDAYLQGDTQLKDQLGSYWQENDLPLNQDWEKIYGEPWGRDEYDEGVAEGIEDNYNKNDAGVKAALQSGVKLIPIQPNNDATGKPIYIHDYSGRYTVIVDMGGISVPFYVSTGSGGKATVAVDKWYPFFGIGSDGWINKGSEATINDFYGSNKLKRVAQVLDNTLGLPSRAKNVTGWSVNRGDENYFISIVNRGLDPAARSDRSTKLRDNMLSVLRRLGEPNKYVEKAAPVQAARPKAYAFDKNNPKHVAAFDATSQSEREIAMALAKDPKSQGVAESVEFMSDAQFYGEILSVLAAMGAGLATGAYLKARDIVKIYNANQIMRALEGYRVGNISDSERQALTKLIAEFKQAMAQRQGEQALAIAKQIKTIATDRPGMAENQGWAATLETVSATGTTANTSGAGAGMTASYQRRDNQPISEDYLSERRL